MTLQQSAWCRTTPKRLTRDEPTAAPASGLKSVGSALDVLECFALDGELGVSDIARRLGVAKSTAHRLLQTLSSRGFIEQDTQTGQYRLGLHLYELGQLAQARNELRYIALPTLRRVAAATGHTVNFAVPDGSDVVFIERIENPDGIRILGHTGRRYHAHTTSAGKVIAAFNPELSHARVRAGFPPRARGTVRSAQEWEATLEQVRRDGYAVSHNASFEAVSSVAVPVIYRRLAVASVSVLGPSETLAPQVERLVPVLQAATRRMSIALGG